MIRYEVHLSREPGEVLEPARVRVDLPDGSVGLGTVPGSLFITVDSRARAEHICKVQEETARRSDDRHAWIREIAPDEDGGVILPGSS